MKASHQIASVTHLNLRGQALAELVIACGILIIILMGVVITINFSVTAVALSANKTLSLYYANEGLEIVSADRSRVLAETDADWYYNFDNLTNPVDNTGCPLSVCFEDPIPNTIFVRTLRIRDDSSIAIAGRTDRYLVSTVSWYDGGQKYSSEVRTLLVSR